jgi:hypothetical protein
LTFGTLLSSQGADAHRIWPLDRLRGNRSSLAMSGRVSNALTLDLTWHEHRSAPAARSFLTRLEPSHVSPQPTPASLSLAAVGSAWRPRGPAAGSTSRTPCEARSRLRSTHPECQTSFETAGRFLPPWGQQSTSRVCSPPMSGLWNGHRGGDDGLPRGPVDRQDPPIDCAGPDRLGRVT